MDFVENEFDARRRTYWNALFEVNPVLFLMIEENFIGFVFAGMIRSLQGKKTSGLLFRIKPIFESNSIFSGIKKITLLCIKKYRVCNVISIVHSSVEPRIDRLVSDTIYDFQFWDMVEKVNLKEKINKKSGDENEVTVVVLGKQSFSKGFRLLPEFLYKLQEEFGFNVHVRILGRVDVECRDIVDRLKNENCYIKDEYISNEEILNAYKTADYVWCCYTPSYDQSSGIFGRSLQFGVTPIVRKGSITEKYCVNFGFRYMSIDVSSCESIESIELIPGKESIDKDVFLGMKESFIQATR